MFKLHILFNIICARCFRSIVSKYGIIKSKLYWLSVSQLKVPVPVPRETPTGGTR